MNYTTMDSRDYYMRSGASNTRLRSSSSSNLLDELDQQGQMDDALIALRIKVENPDSDESNQFFNKSVRGY